MVGVPLGVRRHERTLALHLVAAIHPQGYPTSPAGDEGYAALQTMMNSRFDGLQGGGSGRVARFGGIGARGMDVEGLGHTYRAAIAGSEFSLRRQRSGSLKAGLGGFSPGSVFSRS